MSSRLKILVLQALCPIQNIFLEEGSSFGISFAFTEKQKTSCLGKLCNVACMVSPQKGWNKRKLGPYQQIKWSEEGVE